ncbi:hypothetical protein ACT453_57105, partial [Bacillus sp. D-CC]
YECWLGGDSKRNFTMRRPLTAFEFLTSIHAVYDELQKLGVPSERMIDPTQSIIHGLKDAKIKAELAKSYSSTVGACIISS